MNFHIKDPNKSNELIVELNLEIPLCLQADSEFLAFNEYFEYFVAEQFHLVNLKSLQFKSNYITGCSSDLNKLIWLVMAHQAYLERNKFIDKTILWPIERKVSEMFSKESEAFEWFQAYHKSVDLYLKSKIQESNDFLPVSIVPLKEIENIFKDLTPNQIEGDQEPKQIIYS